MPEIINNAMAAFYIGTQLIVVSTLITLAVKLGGMSAKLDAHLAKWEGKNDN